jgi:hypothetical protein
LMSEHALKEETRTNTVMRHRTQTVRDFVASRNWCMLSSKTI